MGQNRKKLPCPKIRIFHYPAVIGFPQKMEVTVMAPNHSGDSLGSILGPMGSHWVQKMCQNSKKLPWPKIRIFNYPAVIDFLQKMEVTVMVPNHGGDTIESILGPMGSHWVQKMGQNRKKLPCPQIRIFDYPAVIDFSQKIEVTVMAPNHGGDPLGSILGPVGSHWVKNWVKTVRNYHAPKFEFWITRRSSIFAKYGSYGYEAKSRWGPPRVHLFGSIFSGSKKWVKTVKITMPHNTNFRLSRGHRFFAKNGINGYGAKSRWRPPRVHLGANGVPLGPKNGSKP